MPLYDTECNSCGCQSEVFTPVDQRVGRCPSCNGETRRIVTKVVMKTGDDSPNYLRDTLEVVNKEGGKHCQDFLAHPNRNNYEKWMVGEKIRHIEPGEKQSKPEGMDKKKMLDRLTKNFVKKEAISIGGI